MRGFRSLSFYRVTQLQLVSEYRVINPKGAAFVSSEINNWVTLYDATFDNTSDSEVCLQRGAVPLCRQLNAAAVAFTTWGAPNAILVFTPDGSCNQHLHTVQVDKSGWEARLAALYQMLTSQLSPDLFSKSALTELIHDYRGWLDTGVCNIDLHYLAQALGIITQEYGYLNLLSYHSIPSAPNSLFDQFLPIAVTNRSGAGRKRKRNH